MIDLPCDNITGVILAGGKSSRFGENKALLSAGGKTVIGRIVNVLERVFREIIISTNTPGEYRFLNLKSFSDYFEEKGPLAGIHSSLLNSRTEKIFVVSCDMPLIRDEYVRRIISRGSESEITVASVNSRIQPLFGVYSKSLLPEITRILTDNTNKNYSVKRLLDVSDTEILEIANAGFAFSNINNKEDYQYIKSILK